MRRAVRPGRVRRYEPLRRRPQAASPRVLFVATSQNDGGVERYSVGLAAFLARRGVDIRFACLPGRIVDRLCRTAHVPTLPWDVRSSGALQAIFQLSARLDDERIDIVHVHSRRDYFPVLLSIALTFLRRRHRPLPRLVLHAHMIRPLGSPRRLSGFFFAHVAALVLAVSQAVEERLQATYPFSPGFVRLLHNGVDLNRFSLPASERARRWRLARRLAWGIAADAPVIAMIGRLDAKGQEQMLAVMPNLVARLPDLRLLLVGSEGEPGHAAVLQAQALAANVADHVIFAGPREDIPAVLAASDLLIHLPQDEAFGLALIEAMAAGLPTIASRIGGCREIVQDGVTGALIAPDDPAELTRAILVLLGSADGRAEAVCRGLAGRGRVEREFSLARQGAHLEEIYRELCPSPHPPRP